MAALQVARSFRTKCCLISRVRGLNSLRCNHMLQPIPCVQGPQAIQKMYSSSSKGPSESDEDARNKPIRFSTSKARHMTLSQTLGYGVEIDHNPSKKSIYVGMFLMAAITYIILFLPANEDELDLLELEIEKEGRK